MDRIVYRRAKPLLEAELGFELMALDVDAGQCFGFNSVATDIWRELEQPKTFDQLKTALLDQYEVAEEQCSAELRNLLAALEDEGLVQSGE